MCAVRRGLTPQPKLSLEAAVIRGITESIHSGASGHFSSLPWHCKSATVDHVYDRC